MTTTSSSHFAAAVLAGGQSSRFGSDKALIRPAGQRLLDRQLELLRACGPSEISISGRPGVDYAAAGVAVVLDAEPGLGPLGGLAAVLTATTAPHVLVLAVDLPDMTRKFVDGLLARRMPGVGVVPRSAAGWEPLAAVYPREILPLVRAHLERRELALHRLVDAGVAAGVLSAFTVPSGSAGLFRNVNTPDDLER